MGQPLTTARKAALEAAVKAGNREQYYALLKNYGYKYGSLASGVVSNRQVSGVTANAFAKSVAAYKGVNISATDWKQISVNLMKADWELRKAIGPDSTADLDWKQYRDYHTAVFREKGLPPGTWTAFVPLKLAGSETASAQLWQQMLDAQTYSQQVTSGGTIAAGVAAVYPTYANYLIAKATGNPITIASAKAALEAANAIDPPDAAERDAKFWMDRMAALVWLPR